jgi:serine protease AprX
MKKIAALCVLLIAALALQTALSSPAGQAGKFSPALERILAAPAAAGAPIKAWIYFKDKGSDDQAILERLTVDTRGSLSARAMQRRAKTRGAAGPVDFEDLPLFAPYIDAVRPLLSNLRTESRWLNAVSVRAAPDALVRIAALDCVRSVDVVRGFKRSTPSPAPETGPASPAAVPPPAFLPPLKSIYGPSYRQIEQIRARALHEMGLTGRGVLVCMMDVGFRKSHEAFRSANVIDQHDFVMKDNDVQRDWSNPLDYSDAHGTATWSLLGGYAPGKIIGPAFGADFILARTEDDRSETPIEEDYWAAGIEWAEAHGADVVSSSLGYLDWYQFKDMDGRTAVTTKAANRATALGVVVVNAAGNERRSVWGHIIAPSDGYDVIAVGAVDANGNMSSFSSPGPTADGRIKPEVCAMGVRTIVAASTAAVGDANYQWGSGTSYATPLVAGVAALLLEAHPTWTVAQVREALMSTAGNAASPNNDYGWGIINAAAAVKK